MACFTKACLENLLESYNLGMLPYPQTNIPVLRGKVLCRNVGGVDVARLYRRLGRLDIGSFDVVRLYRGLGLGRKEVVVAEDGRLSGCNLLNLWRPLIFLRTYSEMLVSFKNIPWHQLFRGTIINGWV